MDLAGGGIRQLTDLRSGNEPKDSELSAQDAYLRDQQRRLLGVIARGTLALQALYTMPPLALSFFYICVGIGVVRALNAILVMRGDPGSVLIGGSRLIAKSRMSKENARPGLMNHRAPPP